MSVAMRNKEGSVLLLFPGPFFANVTINNNYCLGKKKDLRDAVCKKMHMPHASFYDCDLTGADFRGANLRMAYLLDCDLTGADFRGADLTRTSFTRSIIISARFEGATLDDVSFEGSLDCITSLWG